MGLSILSLYGIIYGTKKVLTVYNIWDKESIDSM